MVAQGTTLAGRYRLDARLGAGGMGEVWRGEDTVLARTVAVKVLLPGRLNEPGFAVRFQNEARAMATINHPGVVDVYDYGVTEVPGDGPTAFLVMRFVDGEPLDRLLTRLGRIGPEPTMDLIAQAASALQAVHDSGIVHRDVKPGNLLVRSDGTLVLTDFGIARAEGGSRLTDAGMVLGTAAYCAPEQAEGYPVTPAVDIYALGVVAYECLAGHRPFDGDSPVAIALKHIRDQPPPLPPDVPGPVRAVVERAMAKDPAHRWPSAEAMSQAARQAIEAISGSSREAYRPGQAVRPAAESHPGHGPDERLGTREEWPDDRDEDASTVVSPRHDTRAARRARRQRKRGVAGPIVAGIAGCAVVVGLAAAGMKTLASAGSAAPEPSTPQVTWATSSPAVTPSRTLRRRTATPTPRPTITQYRP
ncbi:MAG: serine/threonine protein kinase, partial [Thermobispora bispora]|nr:serine/threonine protein kinase [Thermobispora bispora]